MKSNNRGFGRFITLAFTFSLIAGCDPEEVNADKDEGTAQEDQAPADDNAVGGRQILVDIDAKPVVVDGEKLITEDVSLEPALDSNTGVLVDINAEGVLISGDQLAELYRNFKSDINPEELISAFNGHRSLMSTAVKDLSDPDDPTADGCWTELAWGKDKATGEAVPVLRDCCELTAFGKPFCSNWLTLDDYRCKAIGGC